MNENTEAILRHARHFLNTNNIEQQRHAYNNLLTLNSTDKEVQELLDKYKSLLQVEPEDAE